MPRRKVTFSKGERYHIFNRGNNSQQIFIHPEDYSRFLRLIGDLLPSSAVSLHSYTLLPNHYHLSVSIRDHIDISASMCAMQSIYAKWFNCKYRQHGHVFDGRFKSPLIETLEYFDYLSRYIHRNPVEAHLARSPGDWPYSSYNSYVSTGNGLEVDPSETISRFRCPDDYKQFVACDWERTPWKLENGIWIVERRG